MLLPLLRLIQSLFIFLFGIVPTVRADTNYFTNPASNTGINPIWTLGDTQVIAWETTLEVFNVTIWQQSLVQEGAASQGNIYSKIHATDQVTNFTWAVQLYGFDLDYSNVFFIWINPDGPDGFLSSFFNITEPTSTSTSTDGSSPTSTGNARASNARPSDAANSSPSESSPSSTAAPAQSSSGLSTTGKVALGVGIGIGVPILAALAALVWLKARPSSNNASTEKIDPSGSMMQKPPIPPPSPREVQGEDPRNYYPELPSQQH